VLVTRHRFKILWIARHPAREFHSAIREGGSLRPPLLEQILVREYCYPSMQPTEPFHERKLQPTHIGRYRVMGQVGSGGMGTVYKAFDPELNRTVAVKLPHFHGSPEVVATRNQRFQREARTAAAVAHPNVCPIYDVGEHEGQPFVVMAYIEGESLADWLARQGRFDDPRRAVQLTGQILEALDALHRHGVIHRDLKPANILIDASGRVLVTDFGLARHQEDAEPLTSEGVVIGTPAYMAPEQAAGQNQKIGPCTDLYSVGVILFQMLTGKVPFDGPPLAVLGRIMHETPPRLSTLRPDLDAALETIVAKAMARDIGDRFQSAGQFRQALNSIPSVAALRPTLGDTTALSPSASSDSESKTRPSPAAKTKNSATKSLRIAVAAVACLLVVTFIARQVRQFNLKYPDNALVSRDNYMKIREGMTKMEVEDILGTGVLDGRESMSVDAAGNFVRIKEWGAGRDETRGQFEDFKGKPYQTVTLKLRWHSGNHKVIHVTFVNDRVTSKREHGLYGN
jgi:serine/threonine protein kinase